jgi:hypothetical protein
MQIFKTWWSAKQLLEKKTLTTKPKQQKTMNKDTQREIDGENLQREYEAHLGMLATLEDMGMSKDKLDALAKQWRENNPDYWTKSKRRF